MDENITHFKVSGLKCQGCVSRAHAVLAEIPGVSAAEIDLAGGHAVVTGQIEPKTVCAILSKAGYPTIEVGG